MRPNETPMPVRDEEYRPTTTQPFTWNEARLEAVNLVAEDRLTDEQIYEQLGISRATFYRWKAHPDFAVAVDLAIQRLASAATRRGIGRLDKRMARKERDWLRMQQVQEERARYYEENKERLEGQGCACPGGGSTGLMALHSKAVGKGEIVQEWRVDTGLLAAMDRLEEHAARETGPLLKKAAEAAGSAVGVEAPRDPVGYTAGLFADFLEDLCQESGIELPTLPFEATGAGPDEDPSWVAATSPAG